MIFNNTQDQKSRQIKICGWIISFYGWISQIISLQRKISMESGGNKLNASVLLALWLAEFHTWMKNVSRKYLAFDISDSRHKLQSYFFPIYKMLSATWN